MLLCDQVSGLLMFSSSSGQLTTSSPAATKSAVSLAEPRPAARWRGVEPSKVQLSTLAFP